MSEAATAPLLTYADYLELERASDLRHEFLDGEAWAMAGGTPRHAKLKTNLTSHVNLQLGRSPCQAYDSDLKVRVAPTGLATYPDLTVVCGDLDRDPVDHNAVNNPAAVFEVLSPSTEGWDRGGKFRHLQQVATVRHYVLLATDQASVEHFAREADGSWRYRRFGPGDTLVIDDLGLRLEVDALYLNLPDEAPDPLPPA